MWTGERRLENDGTAIEKVACFFYHTVLKPSFFDRTYVYLSYFIFLQKVVSCKVKAVGFAVFCQGLTYQFQINIMCLQNECTRFFGGFYVD